VLAWSRIESAAGTTFLLFGSLFIPHARDFYSECAWTLLSALALYLLSRISHDPADGRPTPRAFLYVVLLFLLVPMNPILAIVFSALVLLLALVGLARRRLAVVLSPAVFLTGIGLVLGVLLCFLENYIRRGYFLNFGYEGEGFSTPFLRGFVGQLFAPARGIVFFIPTFFVGFFLLRRGVPDGEDRFIRLTLLYGVLLVAGYSKWHSWHGAWYWGPRFLLPLSLFGSLYYVMALKAFWRGSGPCARALLALAGVLSFLVYKVGAAINQSHLLDCLREHPATEWCYWQWAYLPYASLADKHDLIRMVTHRSTLVEVIGLMLIAALLRYAALHPESEGFVAG